MAAFNKFQDFAEQIGNGVHNFSSHALKAALTNTAPVNTNTTLSNITQVGNTGGYSAGGYALAGVTWTEAGGVGKLTITDKVITASGGSVGPFRYVVLYNDTPASPADPLIGWYDYGSSISLADGETFTLDFDGSAGVLTIT